MFIHIKVKGGCFQKKGYSFLMNMSVYLHMYMSIYMYIQTHTYVHMGGFSLLFPTLCIY